MKTKKTKRQEAIARNEKYAAMSVPQKIAALDMLFGKGQGAGRQRDRFARTKSAPVVSKPNTASQQAIAAGYFIGTVEEGSFTPRGGSPQPQMQVVHKGHTYVRDRRQQGAQPSIGDQVMIALKGGRRLGPKVTAVEFLPAQHNSAAPLPLVPKPPLSRVIPMHQAEELNGPCIHCGTPWSEWGNARECRQEN